MPYMYFDPTYLLILPALILAVVAQAKCNSAFNKYSKIYNKRQITGAEAARQILLANGVTGVVIEQTSGRLTDHFDPRTNVIRLSQSVYSGSTVAAVGVACHEAGHAIQHAQNYFPNKVRGALLPASRIGSTLAFPMILLGFLFSGSFGLNLIYLGIFLYSLAVLFTVVTLPVEFNASSRALQAIKQNGLLYEDEYKGAKSVLTAAAMTYVASTVTALLQLLRLFLIANNRRR